METIESSENIVLLIVIALIAILGFCIIDLLFYNIFKRKPKNKKDDDKEYLNSISKKLKELEELEKLEKVNK